jgi:mono/diheme cytochrome c family protein
MPVVVRSFAILGVLVTLFAGYWVLSAHGFSARQAPGPVEARLARALRLATMPTVERPEGTAKHDGKEHWADHCAPCHGADGSGLTAMGRRMVPRVPDMRGAQTQSLSDGQLYWIIQNGVRFSGMPAWGESRDDDSETWALVDLVRALPTLSADAIAEIEHAMPVGQHERREREEEDAFLRGK